MRYDRHWFVTTMQLIKENDPLTITLYVDGSENWIQNQNLTLDLLDDISSVNATLDTVSCGLHERARTTFQHGYEYQCDELKATDRMKVTKTQLDSSTRATLTDVQGVK